MAETEIDTYKVLTYTYKLRRITWKSENEYKTLKMKTVKGERSYVSVNSENRDFKLNGDKAWTKLIHVGEDCQDEQWKLTHNPYVTREQYWKISW